MKKHSNTILTPVHSATLLNLVTEVNETIAFGIIAPQPKIFTSADLWNIRRQLKARVQRRYL